MSEKSTALRDYFTSEGYSKEEAYFYKLNKELLEQRRRQLDQVRATRKEEALSAAHWMKCPKCGSSLKERDYLGIYVDECQDCHGVFLDHGELATLLHAKESHSFLSKLKQLFKLRDDTPVLF